MWALETGDRSSGIAVQLDEGCNQRQSSSKRDGHYDIRAGAEAQFWRGKVGPSAGDFKVLVKRDRRALRAHLGPS